MCMPLANSYFKQAVMCSRPTVEIDSCFAYTNWLPHVGKVQTDTSFDIKYSGTNVMELHFSPERKDLISNTDGL